MVRHQKTEVDELAELIYGDRISKEKRKELTSIIGRSNPIPHAAIRIVELYGVDGISFLEHLVYPLDLAPEGRALILVVATNTDNRIGSFSSILDYTERLDYGESPANILRNLDRRNFSIA